MSEAENKIREIIRSEITNVLGNVPVQQLQQQPQQQPNPESEKTRSVGSPISLKRVNGNTVIFTKGHDGDDFSIHKMPPVLNTGDFWSDPKSVILLGIGIVIFAGVTTWLIMLSIVSGNNKGTVAQPQQYQPMPYSVTNEKCKPSGFLWLGETCNTTKETGYR